MLFLRLLETLGGVQHPHCPMPLTAEAGHYHVDGGAAPAMFLTGKLV
jgi:hypothetical protein